MSPYVGGSRNRSSYASSITTWAQNGGWVGGAHFTNVIEGDQLGRQSAVYTEELFVHDCSKRQGAERPEARLVDALGVLVLTFKLECEVVGQTAALVVPTKEEERVWVPNFERP
jgi:hypothetical protein